MTAGDRPRPLVTAAARQAPLIGAGSLASGPGYLAALAAIGAPIGRYDVMFAVGLSVLMTAIPLLVARGMVRYGEDRVTPSAQPRDNDGNVLTPPDEDLIRLLRDVQRRLGAAQPVKRQGPSGTRRGAAVETARPATVNDAGSWSATGQAWEPEVDWYADQARESDERGVRQRPVRPSAHRLRGQR